MANIARLLFIFLLVASAFAQSHKHWLIAPKPSSAKTYSLPHTNQIKWWWVATNLSDPVANWMAVDGFTDLYQGTGANQPRWTNGQGVHFDGTAAFLSSTGVVVGADYGKLMIVRPTVVNPATYGMIVTTAGDGNPLYVATSKWNNDSVGAYGSIETNIIYDHFTWPGYNGFPIAAGSAFTNGVLAKAGAAWAPTMNELGRRFNNTAYYSGAIYEFIVWVNATNMTLEDITNMHAYCTNKYGFWP